MKWWRTSTTDRGERDAQRSGILTFAAGISLATVALVWLAWTAIDEMRRSTALLQERRASEVLALTSAALNRDMKGAWLSVLVPLDTAVIREDPPYDFLQLTSRAFARFPYPESFIVWTDTGTDVGRTYAFNRADRAVLWDPIDRSAEPYPVTLLRDPPALAAMLTQMRAGARHGAPFALMETAFAGVPYQTVVHYLFASPEQLRPMGLVAFTVNLDWVRREYLSELLRQVATINGEEGAMAITAFDEDRVLVGTSGSEPAAAPVYRRTFPLVFFEPALISSLALPRPEIRQWIAQVQPAAGAASPTSALGTQLLLLVSLAGSVCLIAVILTVRAVRVSGELAAMKSEFVAAVTHELKTPLASIKLVGDTLARGRYNSSDTVRDYAAILSQEERRLSHLIENLLTYSRLSDVGQRYSVEPVDISELIEDALEPFRARLKELGFRVVAEHDAELPLVRGDRAALLQAFANIIDNAIKYSPEQRSLEIHARADTEHVCVAFSDTGVGIPEAEVPKIFEKFYRGRGPRELGSGLGLAIVRRIVRQHGGSVEASSTLGQGTTVRAVLPRLR